MMLPRLLLIAVLCGAWASNCPEDPDLDLCADDPKVKVIKKTDDVQEASTAVRTRTSLMPILLLASAMSGKNAFLVLPFLGAPLAAEAVDTDPHTTCGDLKHMYKKEGCCGKPDQVLQNIFVTAKKGNNFFNRPNPCKNKKPIDNSAGDKYFNNIACRLDGVVQAVEQAGANITRGYVGLIDAVGATGHLAGVGKRAPIKEPYWKAGLCPVNVHWHLGTEHLSYGEYDERGVGPNATVKEDAYGEEDSRRLSEARMGFRCHKYDASDTKFRTPYNWQHCKDMFVGETYEVHWPHSAAGMCNTPWQYQTPFYDGVFCVGGVVSMSPVNTWQKIGVQAQVFVIVNDENYYYPDLFRGMIVDGDMGSDMAYYTGSTTGTSRNNTICSQYAPITWQVDRKCHLISASSFDKMCADMMNQHDDMSHDLHAHGARELVAKDLVANNIQSAQ